MTTFTKNFFFYSKLSPRQKRKFLKLFYLYWGFRSNSYFFASIETVTTHLQLVQIKIFKFKRLKLYAYSKINNSTVRVFFKKKFLLIIIFFN